MPRREMDIFSQKDISRIFIAQNLKEAQRAEATLNKNKVNYSVEVEPYATTGLFKNSNYMGATFYVISGQSEECKDLLRARGLNSGIIDD